MFQSTESDTTITSTRWTSAAHGVTAAPNHCNTQHHSQLLACRVSDVANLGHGSMQRLMKLQTGHPVALSSSVTSLAALASTDVTPASRDDGMDINRAMQQLQAAPQLTDLENWTQWAVACEPALGGLDNFLLQNGMQCTSLHC